VKRFVVLGAPALLVALALLSARASAGPRATLGTASNPTLKILVRQDGWYSIPQASLTGAGFVVPSDLTLLHLQMNGQEVPFQYRNGKLEFYGRALDTLYTDARPYWLSVGATAGMPMQFARARAPAASPSGTYSGVLTQRERTSSWFTILSHAFPGTQVGNNIFGPAVTPNSSPSRQITLANVDTAQTASLHVDLYGMILNASSSGFHTVNVSLNGAALGQINGSGQVAMSGTLPVPAGVLVSGSNTIQFTDSVPNDAVLTDAETLTYPHFYGADSNTLNLPVTPMQPLSIGGFTNGNVRVLDITDPSLPRELFPTIAQTGPTYTISLTPPANTTRLYAFTDSAALSPAQIVQDTPSTLETPANQADLIVVAYHDFINAVQPLVAARQAEGLSVKVVDVDDIYDEFANPLGSHDPGAITSFLLYAKNNWTAPAPKYVLLVGDATNDPRNYTNQASNIDYIPTLFFDATFLESPSDDALADLDGDGKPELGVGRLPVKSAAETTFLVNKILGYAGTAPRSRSALLVSDNLDRMDYPFPQFSSDLDSTSLSPNGVASTFVNRPDNATAASDDATRATIISDASNGPIIVNWFGHGAFTSWNGVPGHPLLQSSNASSITNTNALSLYLMMTCQTGYFAFSGTFRGLGEELLFATNAAVAIWASTGDTVPADQVNAAKVATGDLFGSDPLKKRLGDAMVDAKSSINDVDVMHTWVLLGDPTMRLNLTPFP
jgi:hypothetical protein